jgi:tetratricopeptide (TPR) repeat protein
MLSALCFIRMLMRDLTLVTGLLWQPLTALKGLRDRAPFGLAALGAWLATFLYALAAAVLESYAQSGRLFELPGTRAPQFWIGNVQSAALNAALLLLFVTVLYVPFAIFLANLFERRASFSLVLREEYAAVASCALAALASALLVTLLPAAVISWQSAWLNSEAVVGYFVLLLVIPLPIFAALMTLAIGLIFRIGWAKAAVVTLLSFLSLFGLVVLMQAVAFFFASPFLLLLLVYFLRDQISDLLSARDTRRSFKQNLEAATLNPADASAHYNLGLIYQQRGEYEKAVQSFERASEIDPQEVDAHYQLGRLAREQGKLNEAIEHFEKVVRQAPNHSQYEIWRETGLVYYAAKQYPDALAMLDKFLAQRSTDAEARYWHGMTLAQLGRDNEAAAEMQICIETVRTAPAYKYRTERRWLQRAQNFLRERQL